MDVRDQIHKTHQLHYIIISCCKCLVFLRSVLIVCGFFLLLFFVHYIYILIDGLMSH